MKAIAAVLIVLMSCWCLFKLCVLPARCNYLEGLAERTTLAAYDSRRPEYSARRLAQSTLSQISPCLQCCPNVNLFMIAGACYRLQGRYSDAVRAYTAGLRYDRRPETYFNLGMSQHAAGQEEEAIGNLTMAVKFNPLILSEITPWNTMDRVQHNFSAWEQIIRMRARARQEQSSSKAPRQ